MVLPLIPLVGFGLLVTWFVLYGMHRGNQDWLLPLLDALALPQGSFLKRIVLKPVSLAAHAISWIVAHVDHALSVAASHTIAPVAHFIHGIAVWVGHVFWTAEHFAAQVAHGFERLTTHTIPHAIHVATAPLYRGIDHLERDFTHLRAQLRAFERGIDRLIAHRVLPAIHALRHAISVTIPRELGRMRARERAAERAIRHPSRAWIKRIWRAGWILVGAGLMVRFLTRKFPYLFCRNSTNALKAVCGMDTNLLATLLAGTVALNEVNLRDFCRALQAVEGEIVREIHGFVTLDE